MKPAHCRLNRIMLKFFKNKKQNTTEFKIDSF